MAPPTNIAQDQDQGGSLIEIEAKPGPICLNPAETAVLVVDMQNDFGSEGGMLHRAGIDISMIQKVVAPIATTLKAARTAGMKIVYLRWPFSPTYRMQAARSHQIAYDISCSV